MAATPEVAASTQEAYSDLDTLQWVHSRYVYEHFTQLGNTRVGKMFNHDTRQTFTVNEGDELEPGTGVTVVSLDAEKAVVQLKDATDTMICTGNPKYAFAREWQKNPQPPTDEQRRLALEVYMAEHGNYANQRARRAGRPPAAPWREKTDEELIAEMKHYLATTGREAEERQNTGYVWHQPDPRLLTPEQIQKNRQDYYRAMGIDPNTPPIYRDEERREGLIRGVKLDGDKENPPDGR